MPFFSSVIDPVHQAFITRQLSRGLAGGGHPEFGGGFCIGYLPSYQSEFLMKRQNSNSGFILDYGPANCI